MTAPTHRLESLEPLDQPAPGRAGGRGKPVSAAAMTTKTRHTRRNPCRLCGGCDEDPRGQGVRCHGFTSQDGRYVHCSRRELAGGLIEEAGGTYAHYMDAACRCGVEHRCDTVAAPAPSRNGHRPVMRYPAYSAIDGHHVGEHVRLDLPDRKVMWWEQPDGTKSLGGFPITDLELYGARELPPAGPAVVTEGEKSRDALPARGVAAVGTVTGAAGTPCDDALRPLMAHTPVVLWPDNDAEGRQHMQRIAARLRALGHEDVRRIDWPDAPPKGDAADFTGTDDELRALIDGAEPYAGTQPEQPIADTLDAVRGMLAQYVALTPAQRDAIALWTAHTHAFAAASATPYLGINSAEKRSGKTRLLEVLNELVARPWLTGRTSAAALIRKIDKHAPTLLLDESDAAFKGDKEYAEVLRGVLNTGHRRGGCASVCVGQGAAIDVKDFSTFSAKAIAGIGKLPDTVTDRAIPIIMRRRAPGEAVARFRRKQVVSAARPLHDALAAWAAVAAADLTDAEPAISDALDDRAADGWEPLLAIADLAGNDWPQRARDAALILSAGEARDDDSIGVRLLTDIRDILAAKAPADRIASAELAAFLAAIEDAPWGAWGKREKPLDARALARLLARYGIKPGTIRLSEKDTPKGYMTEAFADAFARYPHSERHNATPDSDLPVPEANDTSATQGVRTATPEPAATPSEPDSESEKADCGGVAAKCAPTGEVLGVDHEHCRACGADASRYTGANTPACERHWAAVAHYEANGHATAEAVRLALAATA